MAGFHGAVAAGAHAVETDVHLSRDGVVVLSHVSSHHHLVSHSLHHSTILTPKQDKTLKRCFGIDTPIADCDWSYLRTLQTVQAPHQGMPRLSDLLEWLSGPGLDPVWVLIDIKTDDDPEALLPALARTIASVPPAEGGRPWRERVVLGGWNVRLFLSLPFLFLTFYPFSSKPKPKPPHLFQRPNHHHRKHTSPTPACTSPPSH